MSIFGRARLALLAALAWTCAVSTSVVWIVLHERSEVVDLALTEARALTHKDLALHEWISSHGGVYVETERGIAPNPYLADHPERDAVTAAGRRLTLLNSSLLLRLVMERYSTLYGTAARSVSLTPHNPVNRPRPWEADALHALGSGSAEYWQVAHAGATEVLRYMAPRRMEADCLGCHAGAALAVGALLGGLSTEVDLVPYRAASGRMLTKVLSAHGAMWVAGMLLIGLIHVRGRRHARERASAHGAVRSSEERLRLLLDSTSEGIYALDAAGRCTLVNAEALRLLGYARADELLGRDLHALIHHTRTDGSPYPPECCPAHRVVRGAGALSGQVELFWRKDGTSFPVEFSVNAMRRGAGSDAAVISFVDISERLRTQDQLRRLSRVVEQSPNAVLIADRAGMIEYVNPRFCALHGYAAAEVVGAHVRLLKSGMMPPAVYADLRAALAQGSEWRGELQNRRKDGSLYWCAASIAPVTGEGGSVSHFVTTLEDLSERRSAERTIRHLAHFDALTGLPNRHTFVELLDQAAADCAGTAQSLALLLLDIDRFRPTNDTLGHEAGDELLRQVAQRLRHVMRAGEPLARLSSDEFGLVLRGMRGHGDVIAVAHKVTEAMAAPFKCAGRSVSASLCAGIALLPRDARASADLLKYADIALERAKQQGPGVFQFYSPELNAAMVERVEMENALRGACERGELTLHYQPQLDVASARIVGFEALLRWNSATFGCVPPQRFVPVAEACGLIGEIGAWVLEQACAQLHTWQSAGMTGLSMAVNISARQFRQTGFAAHVAAVLERSGVLPHTLELEITESLLLDDAMQAIGTLSDLRDMGVRVAIDDFGTGYSSLSYLKRLPIDVLKIDRSFVSDLAEGASDRSIVEAVTALGHSLGLQVLAEGVESAAQFAILRAISCDRVQGYLFGRPAPAAEAGALLAAQQRAPARVIPIEEREKHVRTG